MPQDRSRGGRGAATRFRNRRAPALEKQAPGRGLRSDAVAAQHASHADREMRQEATKSAFNNAALPQERNPLAEQLDLPQHGHRVEQVHVVHVSRGSEPQQAMFIIPKSRLHAKPLRPALPLMIVVVRVLERGPRAPKPLAVVPDFRRERLVINFIGAQRVERVERVQPARVGGVLADGVHRCRRITALRRCCGRVWDQCRHRS